MQLSLQGLISGYDSLLKLNLEIITRLVKISKKTTQCTVRGYHKCCSLVPVCRHLGWEVAAVQHSLYNAGNEGSTVKATLVLRDGDKRVDQWLLLDDVIRPLVVVSVLQLICFLVS